MKVSARAALLHRLECEPVTSDRKVAHARLTAYRGRVGVNQWDIPIDEVQSLLQSILAEGYAHSIVERMRVGVAVNLTVTGHDLLHLTVCMGKAVQNC
jgi:hypothetical protein